MLVCLTLPYKRSVGKGFNALRLSEESVEAALLRPVADGGGCVRDELLAVTMCWCSRNSWISIFLFRLFCLWA